LQTDQFTVLVEGQPTHTKPPLFPQPFAAFGSLENETAKAFEDEIPAKAVVVGVVQVFAAIALVGMAIATVRPFPGAHCVAPVTVVRTSPLLALGRI
jgi:hypothetical protein